MHPSPSDRINDQCYMYEDFARSIVVLTDHLREWTDHHSRCKLTRDCDRTGRTLDLLTQHVSRYEGYRDIFRERCGEYEVQT